MATLTNTQISVTYVGLLKTSANTILTSTAQQITDGSGNNSILFLSTAGVGIGGAAASGKELDVTGNVLVTGDLQVDNIQIDGNTISSTAGTDLNITPLAGQQIVLDGTIVIDAGVVTGATSITSTSFVGELTGNASTSTKIASITNSNIVQLTSSQTLTNKTIDVDNNTVSNIEVDNFKASAIVIESEGIGSNDNDTTLPTSAAVKDYVDTQVTAQDLDFAGGSGTGSVDLDSQTFTIAGTTNEIETSASGQTLTVGLPSTVAITTKITSPIFGLGDGTSNKIQFIGGQGNWRINISDSANQFVIHSESLASDYFTVIGGGGIKLNAYGSGSKTGTVAKNLAVDSSGNIIETDGGVVDGSGTANDVVMWSDSNTLTDAPIAISGNNATFAGNATLSGQVLCDTNTTTPTGGEAVFYKSSAGAVLSGYQAILETGSGGSRATALTIDNSQNSTFAGDVTANGDGSFGTSGATNNSSVKTLDGSIITKIQSQTAGDTAGILGTESNNVLKLVTNNSTAITIDTSQNATFAGRVGIGATSFTFSDLLTIKSPSSNTTTGIASPQGINLNNTNTTDGNYTTIQNRDGNGDQNAEIKFFNISHTNNQGAIAFTTRSGTDVGERMRLDSSGNVGIGTDTPSTYNAQLVSFKDGGSFAYLGHNNSGGTFPKVSALSFGSSAVSFSHTTNGGTNALTGSAQIAAIQSASSNAVTDMAFYTTAGGSVTEKMRLDSSGNLGIGQAPSTAKLEVAGEARVYTGSNLGYWGVDAGNSYVYFGTNSSGYGLSFQTSGAEKMRLDSSGNLIVNDTSSDLSSSGRGVIEINGTSQAILGLKVNGDVKTYLFQDGDNVELNNTASGSLTLKTAATTALTLDSSQNATFAGNVLIGATSAAAGVLVVDGNSANNIWVVGRDSDGTGSLSFRNAADNAYNARLEAVSGALKFETNGTLALTIDSSGQITNTMSGGKVLTDTNGFITSFQTLDTATAGGRYMGKSNRGLLGQIRIEQTATSADGGYISFDTSPNGSTTPTAKMRITSGGDIAVGVTSAQGRIHIHNSGTSYLHISNDTTGSASGSGTDIGVFTGTSDLQINNREAASVAISTSNTERMRIASGGNLLVGITDESSQPTTKNFFIADYQSGASITVGGHSGSHTAVLFRHNGATTPGSIVITTNTTTYNTSSDYRLKEDLQDFAGLDMVSKIPVYDFKWKTDESRSYGVMAHELEEVLPQAVNGEKDAEEMQGVDYSKIVPLLVKAIQELQKEIEILKNK